MSTIRDIFYTSAKRPHQSLDLYLPDCENFPVFIYFHGGGFTGGDKSGYHFIPQLVDSGIAYFSGQ